MKNTIERRVAIAFPPTRFSRIEKMRGVFRFIAEKNNWKIEIIQGELTPDRLESFDGIIITGTPSADFLNILDSSSIPAAFIEVQTQRATNAVIIHTDDHQIAYDIVRFFTIKGVYQGASIIQNRQSTRFFVHCAKRIQELFSKQDIPCEIVSDPSELTLTALPHAIFAVSDEMAAKAISHCQANGLRVPLDVSVLGFANDFVLCENSHPSISSVDPDFEMQGYLAARELNRLMSACRPGKIRTFSAGTRQIIERKSTALHKTGEGLVRDALKFIHDNATRPIGVMDVVQYQNTSRRLIEVRFRERCGRSILETIHHFRLEATKKALLSSHETISNVCQKCGWKSENGPKKLFKQTYGLSMRQYRTQHSAPK